MKKLSTEKKPLRKKKWHNSLKLILLIALILIIVFFIISSILSYKKLEGIQTLDVNVKVGDHLGFNLDSDSLNFGTITPGGGSSRGLILESEKPLMVHISFEGSISKWVVPSKNDFVLNGRDNVSFSINVPPDANLGDYTGKVFIIFTKI